jgi:hypothetical protein
LGHHFPKGNGRHFDRGDWLKYNMSLPRHSREADRVFLIAYLSKALSNMVVSVVKLL